MKNSFLITGGSGSFGNAFIKKLINSKIKINRLVILVEMNSNNLKWNLFIQEKISIY